jgi:hypothetical protein
MAPGLDLTVLAREVGADNTIPISNTNIKTVAPTTLNSLSLVLDPSTVTQEFDELRFEAAASRQLPTPNNPDHTTATSTQLISSPYNNPGHYLDLTTLDTPNLIFAKALTALKPLRSDYATAPYISSLDFSSVLSLIRRFSNELNYTWTSHTFYVVIFRSQLKPDIDNDLLYKLDYESHREACESGGLLKYWFGKTDGERRNLATCEFIYSFERRGSLFGEESELM